jgi:hypothetical protein
MQNPLLSLPTPLRGSVTPQPACSPPRATTRSSSPGAAWPGPSEQLLNLRLRPRIQLFTPSALDLDKPSSVQSALAELVKRGQPIDLLLINAEFVPTKARVITAASVEAARPR